MSGFLYAIPVELPELLTGENFREKALCDHLLGHLQLRTLRDAAANSIRIPGKGNHCLISPNWATGPAATTYEPDSQTWLELQLGDDKAIQIGWQNDSPPGPADLQRQPVIPGYPARDSLERIWHVPIARSPVSRETLPTDCTFDMATGKITRTRSRQFDALWELSGKIWDYWNDDSIKADEDFVLRAALQILQVNYRISQMEINAFVCMDRPLLDDVRAALICLCLIDMEVIDEDKDVESKKNSLQAD